MAKKKIAAYEMSECVLKPLWAMYYGKNKKMSDCIVPACSPHVSCLIYDKWLICNGFQTSCINYKCWSYVNADWSGKCMSLKIQHVAHGFKWTKLNVLQGLRMRCNMAMWWRCGSWDVSNDSSVDNAPSTIILSLLLDAKCCLQSGFVCITDCMPVLPE